MPKKPITETLELVSLVATLGITIEQARKDGKVDIADLGGLISLIPKVGPAIEGIEMIPEELADLDPQEQEVLLTRIGADLKAITTDPRTLAIAAAAIKTAAALLSLGRAIDGPATPVASE